MSAGDAADLPPVTIPLAGGALLRVDGEGLHFDTQVYRLDDVLDARMLSVYPEVVGLTIAGVMPFTFMAARPGEGAVALEAIYARRPDLRVPTPPPPPGFAPPPGAPAAPGGAPAGFPALPQGVPFPPPGYIPPPPGYVPPPPGYIPPPPGYIPPPPGYGPAMSGPGTPGVPGTGSGGLGFWPQGIGEVIGTTFRLYFKNFPRLALLSLAVAFLPAVISGGIQVAIDTAQGLDVTQSILGNFTNPANSTSPLGTGPYGPNPPPLVQWMEHPDPGTVLAAIGIGLLLAIIALVLNSWQAAALALGARDAVLGRPVRVGAALGGGLRRVPAVLGAYVLIGLIFIGMAVVIGVVVTLLGLVLGIGTASMGYSADGTPSPGLAVAGAVGFLTLLAVYIVFLVAAVYISVRLGLAPYAAAADRLSPTAAIARGWSLVRRNWWRTFLPVFVIGLIVGFVTAPAGVAADFISIAVTYLVLVPIITALAAPLSVLAYVVIYYDLRLRREGYQALAGELGLPAMPAMPMMPFWPPVMPPPAMPPTGMPPS